MWKVHPQRSVVRSNAAVKKDALGKTRLVSKTNAASLKGTVGLALVRAVLEEQTTLTLSKSYSRLRLRGHIFLHSCYSGFVMLLQWICHIVTVDLSYCYSAFVILLQWICHIATVDATCCYSGFVILLQWMPHSLGRQRLSRLKLLAESTA